MRHRLLPIAGLLLLCVSLAACGGSTTTTATATTVAPTRAAASAPATASASAATVAPAATTAPAAPSAPATTVVPVPTAPAATAAPVPTAAAATTAPTAAAPAAAATTAGSAGGNTVAVELKDFMIALDKTNVSAGMVTFNVKNSGPSPHNFNVSINGEEKGIMTLDAGKTGTLTLDLKPGAYTYRCNVPGHDLLGMKGTLTAK